LGGAVENLKALLSDILAERRERGLVSSAPYSTKERHRYDNKVLELWQALSEENAAYSWNEEWDSQQNKEV
jgi:hypothetical protein